MQKEEKMRSEALKVLLLDDWCKEAKESISEYILTPRYFSDYNNIYGVIVSMTDGKIQLRQFPNLKFVASCTTGLDHIDTDYCKEKSIKVISLQGEREFLDDVWATAEHTMALILSLVRMVPFAHEDVCRGGWNREYFQGTELRGKTIGIVGYGRVGQQVSRLAKAFGMDVLICDRPGSIMYSHGLEKTLKNSDIITVHVQLNEETRGMFSHKEFSMMKPTAYFINTSRGAVVNEDALLNTLLDKKIAGASIDVVNGEPSIGEELREYAYNQKNLIITPHIGGNTAESRKKTQIFIANKIKEFIDGSG